MSDLSLVLLCIDHTMRTTWPIALGFLERIRLWRPGQCWVTADKI
jgi:hypothetical protein